MNPARRDIRVKAVVTGAKGFIGHHLCHLLRERGDVVTEVDLPEFDITDPERIRGVLTRCRPEVIYHLAAQANAARSWTNPLETWTVNVLGTAALLETARSTSPDARILIMSSASIYDGLRPSGAIQESWSVKPRSPYGLSKAMVEKISKHYTEEYDMDILVARPFNAIGPGQRLPYLIPALAQRVVIAVRTAQTAISIGNISVRRDFVDVRDVAEALIVMVGRGHLGYTYNICSGRGISIGSIAHRLIALSGVDIHLVTNPVLQRDTDASEIVGDPSFVSRETRWTARIPLETTLSDVLSEWSHRS